MVETARLESAYTGNRIGGSNPSLSASLYLRSFALRAQDSGTRLPLRSRHVAPEKAGQVVDTLVAALCTGKQPPQAVETQPTSFPALDSLQPVS